jgi:hypothetical protein
VGNAQQDDNSNATGVWAMQQPSPSPASPAAGEQLMGSDGAAPSDVPAPASLAVIEQPRNGSAADLAAAAAPATPSLPAVGEQQPTSDINAAAAGVEASDVSAQLDIAGPASPAAAEQQLEDGNTTVGWAVHPSASNLSRSPAASSPVPEQQAADTSNPTAEPASPNAGATPEPAADQQDGDNGNMTVAAASVPNAVADPQRTPAVDDLRGVTAGSLNSSPTVVDLLAGSDQSGTAGEQFAQVASVQDDAPVDDISMVGPGGASVTDLSSGGVEEKAPARKGSSNDSAVHRSQSGTAAHNEFLVNDLVSIPYTRIDSSS